MNARNKRIWVVIIIIMVSIVISVIGMETYYVSEIEKRQVLIDKLMLEQNKLKDSINFIITTEIMAEPLICNVENY